MHFRFCFSIERRFVRANFRQNLISDSKLNESGDSVIFDSGLSITRNNRVLIRSVPKGSLYAITCMHKTSINVACKTSNN